MFSDREEERLKEREVEIVIPEEVRDDLAEGRKRVKEKMEKHQPQVVVTLDRSGTLAANALDLVGVKRLRTNLGREITERIGDQVLVIWAHGVEQKQVLEEELEAFCAVLEGGPEAEVGSVVQERIEEMAEEFGSVQKEGRLGNILAIDDVEFHGPTISLLTPYVVMKALKRRGLSCRLAEDALEYPLVGEFVNREWGDDEPEILVTTECLFKKQEWMARVIVASFPELRAVEGDSKEVRRGKRALGFLVKEVMRGYIEGEKGDLVKIETREQVEELGKKYAEKYNGRNPVEFWRELYGDDEDLTELLSVYGKTKTALEEVGRSLAQG